ncbi:MAG: hypothetical protein K2X97_01665, partial [Mycobacteriaceae bacterium]|nr:hypothetical protein [Mycobacteriaceae bacterium]
MRRKTTNWKIILILSIFFAQAAIAAEQMNISANIQDDSSLQIIGEKKYQHLDFSNSNTKPSCNEGPQGLKSVTFAPHLYIKGETKRPIIDSREKDGWFYWFNQLAQLLGQTWRGDIPGQMQLLMQCGPKGELNFLQEFAFFPGVNSKARVETKKDNPELEKRFREALDTTIQGLSKSGSAAFPKGSTASSALLLVTFVADHDLQVWLPELKVLNGVPDDERSIRIARMCCALDTAYLFDQSDRLRMQLPEGLRHRFVPDKSRHQFFSQGKDVKEGTYSVDNGTSNNCPDLNQLSPYAASIFDAYL